MHESRRATREIVVFLGVSATRTFASSPSWQLEDHRLPHGSRTFNPAARRTIAREYVYHLVSRTRGASSRFSFFFFLFFLPFSRALVEHGFASSSILLLSTFITVSSSSHRTSPLRPFAPEPRPSFIHPWRGFDRGGRGRGVRPSSLRVESLPSCFLAYLARSRCF